MSSQDSLHASICAYVASQRGLPGVDGDSVDVCVSVLRELWRLPASAEAAAPSLPAVFAAGAAALGGSGGGAAAPSPGPAAATDVRDDERFKAFA